MKPQQKNKRPLRNTRVADKYSHNVAPLLTKQASSSSLSKSTKANPQLNKTSSFQTLFSSLSPSKSSIEPDTSSNQAENTPPLVTTKANTTPQVGKPLLSKLSSKAVLLETSHAQTKTIDKPRVLAGCTSKEGTYHSNEDRFAFSDFADSTTSRIDAFCAILDGHGGESCSHYIASVISTHIQEHFLLTTTTTTSSNSNSNQTTSFEKLWEEGESILLDMFHGIEEEFSEIAAEDEDTSGACCTVVLVKGFDVLVANIGDCRAVAFTENKVEVLTDDHRADCEKEKQRIFDAGGSVVNGRVLNLQPSRSFGDFDVKEVVPEGVIIPTPELRRFAIKPSSVNKNKDNSFNFLIVASDGLWDSVSNDDACQFCLKVLRENANNGEKAMIASQQLVKMATDRRATDDITVAVIVWE